MKTETNLDDPFDDASAFHFESKSLGEEFIHVYMDGRIFAYDKVHVIMVGGAYPMVFGMIAVEDDDEDIFLPADSFPLEQVERIENPTDDANRIGE